MWKNLGCLLKVKQSHKWITPTTPKTREFHNLLSKWILFKEYASEYWIQQPFSSLYILLDAAITATNSPNAVIIVWRTATQFENHRLRLFMSRIVQTEPRRLDIETVDGTNCYSNSSSRQFKINLKFQLAIQRAFLKPSLRVCLYTFYGEKMNVKLQIGLPSHLGTLFQDNKMSQ